MANTMLLSSKIRVPASFRCATARSSARARPALHIRAETKWSLMHQGKEMDLTDKVGKKSVCTIKGSEASDFDKV